MKRSESLQPLSREHHEILMFCLLLKKGIKKHVPLEILTDFIQKFSYHDLEKHFLNEEKNLVPILKRNNFSDGSIRAILLDHEIARNLIYRISLGGNSYKILEAFSSFLEQQVRFEERFLFESIQQALPEGELFALQFESNGQSVCKTYPVKFWE